MNRQSHGIRYSAETLFCPSEPREKYFEDRITTSKMRKFNSQFLIAKITNIILKSKCSF